jgi:hypothetical protein
MSGGELGARSFALRARRAGQRRSSRKRPTRSRTLGARRVIAYMIQLSIERGLARPL